MSLPPKTHNIGALSADLVAKGKKYYTANYKPREMILDHAKGSTIWDLDGRDYIDLGAGIAVCGLGHQDPDLLAALDAQSRKIWHTSNVFFTEPPIHLTEMLVETASFARRAYLCKSGTEANEAAIKLVRKYAADKGKAPEQRNIITFAGSFHGRTLAAVTATAQPKYQQGFEPLPGGFSYCPAFNDEAAIEAMVDEKTCAIFVEPVQGEGGVMPSKPGFLKHLRALCDKVGALLVVDEIQSGMGRTGKLWAHEYDAIQPDVLTSAKALGGGLPIGAMLVGEKAAETFQFGSHGSTFGGNPVMAAVGLASLKKLNNPLLLAKAVTEGDAIRDRLRAFNEKTGLFADIRGRGMMIGAELVPAHHGKANDIADFARAEGVLILVAGPNVLRLLPPLTIGADELEKGLSRLEAALTVYLAEAATKA